MPKVYTVAPGLRIVWGAEVLCFESPVEVSEPDAVAFEKDRRKRFRVVREAPPPPRLSQKKKPKTREE